MYQALEKPGLPAESLYLPATTRQLPWRSCCASCSCAGSRVSCGTSLSPIPCAPSSRPPGNNGAWGEGAAQFGGAAVVVADGHPCMGSSARATRASREDASVPGSRAGGVRRLGGSGARTRSSGGGGGGSPGGVWGAPPGLLTLGTTLLYLPLSVSRVCLGVVCR